MNDGAGAHAESVRPRLLRTLPLEPTDHTCIGIYRIRARLGVGGMGTVYLGTTPDHDAVAVKLVHPHLAADQEFRHRFASEAHAGLRVPQHCSAAVLATGEHEGQPYLVTEYIDGVPLSTMVAEEGPLDASSMHSLAVGSAAGLVAIHSAGLVHRDVKPSNIIVTLGGVRIIDFGIARALDETHGYTQTGVVMGSLGWAAPEQLSGAKPRPAMDIFAWGCVMAYAASGHHPFGPGGIDTRANRVMTARPDLTGVPEPLRTLVRAALSKSPATRPTAQDLLLALVSAAPPRLRRWPKVLTTMPGRTAAAVISVPLALALAIGATGAAMTANESGDDGSGPGPSSTRATTGPGGATASGHPRSNDGMPIRDNGTPDTTDSGHARGVAGASNGPGAAQGAGGGASAQQTPANPTAANPTTTHTPNPHSSKNNKSKSA